MDSSNIQKNVRSVVLVADVIEQYATQNLALQRSLEQSDPETITTLIDTIRLSGREVTHYISPDELAANAHRHQSDIVLSIYGGTISRNRMALVPAVCETHGLRVVGPDVYGRVIAQDKEISKRLAKECGLLTPRWKVARRRVDLDRMTGIRFPCVVKPLLEGSSIGISQRNLVHSFQQAKDVATHLLETIKQPVLFEEFVPGREAAFVAIESTNELYWGYSEVAIEGHPKFFDDRLFDAHEKVHATPGRTVKNIDAELNDVDLQGIKNLLHAYGRFGYCRVDGRHRDGRFHFLELTPDAWIDPEGQFAMGFTKKGWTYDQVIETLLLSAE